MALIKLLTILLAAFTAGFRVLLWPRVGQHGAILCR